VTLFAAEDGRAVLVELSVMEQRYHAVMEVISGAPVTEVARRYGVSRQGAHLWLGKYKRERLAGLADHPHRPHFQPRQLEAGIEGPPPAGHAPGVLAATSCVEVQRLVNSTGIITLGGQVIQVGSPLAGQRARIRLDGQVMHVITQDGIL
jgi:transposase-like protein